MSDNENEIKRRKLPQVVIRALIDSGKTIEEISFQKNPKKKIPVGNPEQIQHQSKSIWHSKSEIDNYVKNKLNITDEEWNTGDSNHPSYWYTYVAQEITKLRNDGTIIDWNPELRTGIWRLTHLKGIESSEPKVKPEIVLDKDLRFFIALGPWVNWEHSLNNPPFRWGVNPSTPSNVGVYNLLRPGDIVYYYTNQDKPTPFSKRGLFGVGKVSRVYEEEEELYWPDEKLQNKIIYKHRFEIESIKFVQSDSKMLPWIEGLPFTKGLNRIANNDNIKQLLENTEKIWNINLKHYPEVNNPNLTVKDSKSTLPLLSSKEIDEGYDLISKELTIPKEKIIEIITALLSGRHILLAGPIGTGKTRLATLIPQIFWKKCGGYASEDHTATSDWSTLDVIGGIMPKMEGKNPKYEVQKGCVTDTVIKNSKNRTDHSKFTSIPYRGTWLIIDEFNRADIDKAFGQLFTALRTRNLKIPSSQMNEYYDDLKILKDYRIIGTLNTADKHFLFNLSDALKSRFAYIEVDIAKKEIFEEEMYYAAKNALDELELETSFDKIFFDHTNKKINKEKSDSDFYNRMIQAYGFLDTVRIFKKLGTAILKLIFQNLIVGVLITNNSKTSLDNALTSNLIPQLENMSLQHVSTIHAIHSDKLDSFLKQMSNDLNKQNYVQSFEKILDYLEIPEKEQIILDFEKNTLPNDSEIWNQIKNAFDKKKENYELNLEQMLFNLEDLKKSMIL